MIDELMFNNHFYAVANLMKLGANSCISRAANIDEIYKAIDTVMYRDEYYFNELVKKSIYETTRSHKGIYTVEPDLTVKEIEVMKFTCEDRDTKEIGELMGLSPRTIGAMRGVIYTKTGTKSCAGIVMYAIRHGIYAMN
jgi:DNA-binding NarL/FixJ family response regulator